MCWYALSERVNRYETVAKSSQTSRRAVGSPRCSGLRSTGRARVGTSYFVPSANLGATARSHAVANPATRAETACALILFPVDW